MWFETLLINIICWIHISVQSGQRIIW